MHYAWSDWLIKNIVGVGAARIIVVETFMVKSFDLSIWKKSEMQILSNRVIVLVAKDNQP